MLFYSVKDAAEPQSNGGGTAVFLDATFLVITNNQTTRRVITRAMLPLGALVIARLVIVSQRRERISLLGLCFSEGASGRYPWEDLSKGDLLAEQSRPCVHQVRTLRKFKRA